MLLIIEGGASKMNATVLQDKLNEGYERSPVAVVLVSADMRDLEVISVFKSITSKARNLAAAVGLTCRDE